jgi:hypothetical protein
MKKLIVPSLLASLLFIVPVLANETNGNNDNCNSKFASPNCLNAAPGQVTPPPPIVYPPHPPGPPPGYHGGGYGHGWHHGYPGGVYFNFQTNPYNDYYDNNYNDNSYNDYVDRCTTIRQSLRRSGFRQVRAIACGGRNYIYTALRDGERLRITVSRNSGRIIRIRPIY